MKDTPIVGDAALALLNNPKVALASSGSGIGMGYLARENLEFVNSLIGTATMAVGFVTGTVVCAVWIIKLVRYWNSTAIEPSEPKG